MNLFKKAVMGFAAVAVAALPLATARASHIRLESSVQAANVTAGDTTYRDGISARVDEVVKIEVWYHNREAENSGLVANNLRVKINLPQNVRGRTQTVTSNVSADHANTVTDTTNINLSLDTAYLEYIPGSAQWRHNRGTNAAPNYVTESISDAVVTGAGGLMLENAQPCFNFEAYVTVLARVRADSVSINKQVRKLGETDWVKENTAKPGDTLEYLITVKNEGNTVLRNVTVGDNLPPRMTYVPGSTRLRNGNYPNGTVISNNNITTGGIDIGAYNPGGVAYVWFQVKIDSNLAPGTYEFKNVGIVRPTGMNESFNTATTRVQVVRPNEAPPPTQPPVGGGGPLPQTGPESAAAGLAGMTAVGYATRAWVRGKRELLAALRTR